MVQGNDKRLSPRAAADFMVEIYDPTGEHLMGIGKLVNISESGMCIESASAFLDASDQILRLLLGKRHLLTLPARIVWAKSRSHTREYGLKFGEIPEKAKTVLQKFVLDALKQEEPKN